MSIPDFQTLMLPVLRLAKDGEVRISDVVDRLADEFALSPEDRSKLLPSGRQTTFANRVHWARTHLVKAGLLTATRRAYFTITDRGKAVLTSPPGRIDISFLNQFPEFVEFRRVGADQKDDERNPSMVGGEQSLTPDEVMRAASHQLEAALAGDLLDRVRSAPPAFFEKLVIRLLIAMGYGGGSVTDLDKALVGKSGDGGVDGVIDQDPLGLDRIYVQAKCYAATNTVGSGAIRDFFGSLDRFKATKGLFVTTSLFTSSAKETNEFLSKRIVLIDGQQLARLMIRHGVGCRVEETLTIKALDEAFFEN